ncbi:hypothetical protein [Rhodoferax sp. U11-2br]|uniref:hypothetical protein n=1 Tax=Rhodoferax sp. U11-2br TaxID=2838878 RepID=UPI001BE612A5|nr:hypothetical protein [Rhodoferax sp. U11-2br]MBT3066115.1 hypothetical protein [Rhodoferax sp. U11-2br]
MPKAPYAAEIRKTGFVLENDVAQTLRASGWTVISNKFYVDDSEESVREIDLVAYRVSKVQHFDVYTVLIVSCKKSEANAWALLARDINLKDPNSDWWPLHAWSNDKALAFQLAASGRAKAYHDAAKGHGVVDALSQPDVEVFAFQEMDKGTGKPQNDKPIFGAITSLMKAQAYELSALPGRKKAPAVYQFNLLSVVDTDLIRLKFSKTDIKQTEVDTEHYLARYIIRKREVFARIRFVRAGVFSTVLEDYVRLHLANCKWFATECDAFYSGVIQDWNRSDTLLDDFFRKIRFAVEWRLEGHFEREFDLSKPALYWDKTTNAPRIGFELPDDVIDFMTEDSAIKKYFADALKSVFRYDGPFSVSFDIPF